MVPTEKHTSSGGEASFLKKRWVKIFIGVFLVLAAGTFLVPLGAKYSLEQWLVKNGAEHANIKKIWLNPFAGKITIGDVAISMDGQKMLTHSSVELNVGLYSLFSRDIHIEKAHYKNLSVEVEQYADGRWRFASYTTGKPHEKTSVGSEPQLGSKWNVLASEAILTDCQLHLKTPKFNTTLRVAFAKLNRFTTKAGDKTGKFELSGTLDASPLSVRLDTLRVAPYIEIGGSLDVTGYSLNDLSALLEGVLDRFSGNSDVHGAIHFVQSGKDGLSADFDGSFGLSGTDIANKDFQVKGDRISYIGKIHYSDKPEENKFLEVDGKVQTKDIEVTVPEKITINQEELELTSQGKLVLGVSPTFQGNSSLVASNFQLLQPGMEDSLFELDTFTVAGFASRGATQVSVDEVKAQGVTTRIIGAFPLKIEIPEITFSGVKSDDFRSVSAARLALAGSKIMSELNKREFLRAGLLNVEDVVVDREHAVTAKSADLGELYLFSSDEKSARKNIGELGKMKFSGFRWDREKGLRGDSLIFNDLFFHLSRGKDGEMEIGRYLAEMRQPFSEQESTTTPPEDESSSGVAVRVGTISVRGKSGLDFEDNTLEIPFRSVLDLKSLQVVGLDSGQPDNSAQISMEGMLEKRAIFKAQGDLAPFGDDLKLSMNAELKNYPLKSLSAYTVQSVGTALASGQLHLETDLVIAGQELDMNNSILLKRLKTETISKELAEKLDNQLPISLSSALSVLRDSKGDIELEIPINGPVSDLDVGIADILITGLGKAIVPAASSYFVYALGPYGALAYVGMKVGEKIMQVNLPPVVFAPMGKELTPEHEEYLERVGTILKDRPETDIQICPVTMSWELKPEKERQALQGENVPVEKKDLVALNLLGQERAEAVKKLLSGVYEIDPNRLLVCATKVETEKEKTPHVNLYL